MTPQIRFSEFTETWQLKTLGKIFDVRDGTHESPQYFDSGKPLITSKNLRPNGTLDLDNVSYISESDFTAINKRSGVDVGDILFGMIGTIGNPVIVGTNDFAIKNVALIKPKDISTKYLIQYLGTSHIARQFYQKNSGGTQKFISLSDIRSLQVALPDEAEQQKIIDFLTAIDETITTQEHGINMLETYKRGTMQHLFSRHLRFTQPDGSPYPEWHTREFDDVLQAIPSKKYQLQTSNYSKEGRYPVVDQGKKTIVGYSDYQEKLFTDSPVIVFGDHTTILKYIDFDFIVGADGTKILKEGNKDNLRYLYYFLQMNRIAPEGYKRHFSILKEMYFDMPTHEEQQKIANFLYALDSKLLLARNKLARTKQYKKALLQRMFA